MKTFGIQLAEGSEIDNLTVASGSGSFPANPSTGELFFRTDSTSFIKGLYVYTGASWTRIPTELEAVVPHGATLPPTPTEGQLFYKSSDDNTEALYYYDEENGWVGISSVNSGRYTHTQGTSSATWTVAHNLGLASPYIASVDCFIFINSAYRPAFPQTITFDNANQLTVTWSSSYAGYAIVRK